MTIFWIVCILFILAFSPVSWAKGGKKPPKRVKIEVLSDEQNAWSLDLFSNIYRGTTYLNPSIEYSTGGWNFGVSSQNIPVYGGGAQNYEYDTYVNVARSIRDRLGTLTVGTQAGTTLFTDTRQLHSFSFADHQFPLTPFLSVHGGLFYVNAALSTATAYVGGLAGFELKLIPGLAVLDCDYLGGHTNVSGAVCNATYFVTPSFGLYFGVSVPERNSGNEFAGNVGITLSTHPLN